MMSAMHRLTIQLVIALIMIVSFLACKVTRVTEMQVEERISKELPLGSTVPEVVRFLDALEINGLKPRQYGYIPSEPVGTERLKGMEDRVKGYLAASIENSARDGIKLQVYRIYMTFYFDRDERLIAHKTITQGDW
jgi:hypothetical protein